MWTDIARKSKNHNPQGQVLIFTLVFVVIIMVLSGALVMTIFVYYQNGQKAYMQEAALQLAEAGIDKAIFEINQPGGGSYTGESGVVLGNGTYNVGVTDMGSNKIIESTGYIPNSINPKAKKTVRLELVKSTIGASFIYGVQVGYGGLSMDNNSVINGSVYSNGTITGNVSGVSITGDVWVAGGVSPSPDQEQTIQTGEQNVGDITERTDAAQSFVAGVTQPVKRVSLLLKRFNNPSNATVMIVADNAGSPSKTVLASGTLYSSSVGTSFGWVDISFSVNPQLNTGQKYWIVIDVGSPRSNRYYTWAKHDNSGYGNGVGKHSEDWGAASPVWVDSFGDFGFQTWMGLGNTKVSSLNIGIDAHANTIENATVGRDAFFQTITGSTVAGTQYPGSADPPTLDMPISDAVIEDFKAMAASGGTITPPSGTHLIDAVATDLGPVKIAGNLRVDNGAVVTIKGPVWVEGDIILSNNVLVVLDTAFGSDSTVMLADYPADRINKGKIRIENNAQILGSGDPDSYIMLLSTNSHPINSAIDVTNNTDGAIIYSSKGTTKVFNNVAVKEAIAYRLELSNNAVVNYESGLSSVNFSAGPSGGWLVKRGSWQILPP